MQELKGEKVLLESDGPNALSLRTRRGCGLFARACFPRAYSHRLDAPWCLSSGNTHMYDLPWPASSALVIAPRNPALHSRGVY